jgi:hypothetical protein
MLTMKVESLPTTVQEVLEDLGIQIVSIGREISAHCPFHTDAHPSFSINASTGLFICYQCQEAGTLEDLLVKCNTTKGNTVEYLREVRQRKMRKTRQQEREPEPPEEPLIDPFVLSAQYETFKQPPQWAHEERHITSEQMHRFGVRWDKGWIIPIWSPSKTKPELWGWQFKRLDFVSNFPKQVKKSQTLFGYHQLTGTTVALVESPLDVVRLASVAVPAVSSFGAFVSRRQLTLLHRRAKRVVLALDNDEEGNRQSKRIYLGLAKSLATSVLKYPEGVKDPGEMSDDQIVEAFGR